MSKISSRTASLHEMIKLEERRSALEKQLLEVESRLRSLANEILGKPSGNPSVQNNSAPSPIKTRARRGSGTRVPRGSVTNLILKELKEAGPKGVAVSELSKKLNRNYSNIYVWFSTTGRKKFPNIEKLAKGRFRLTE